MSLPWYYDLVLMLLAVYCGYIAFKRRYFFSMVIWILIGLYYVLVYQNALSSETRHLYGRINILLIMLSEVIPYTMNAMQRITEKKNDFE